MKRLADYGKIIFDEKFDASIKKKDLHGAFAQETQEMPDSESWTCLERGFSMKETKRINFAALEQVLKRNFIK